MPIDKAKARAGTDKINSSVASLSDSQSKKSAINDFEKKIKKKAEG